MRVGPFNVPAPPEVLIVSLCPLESMLWTPKRYRRLLVNVSMEVTLDSHIQVSSLAQVFCSSCTTCPRLFPIASRSVPLKVVVTRSEDELATTPNAQ